MAAMPELPEVEATRRHVAPELTGRRIVSVEVRRPRMVRRHERPVDFADRLTGRRITGTRRHGKYMLVDVDGDIVWVTHLGMSGRVQMANIGEGEEPPEAEVVGDVQGRHCVIVDDMIDTAGTAVAAAELLMSRGALDVKLVATHGVLSVPAVDRLKNAPITEVVISNTLPVPDDASDLDKLTVLSIGKLLAGAIDAIFTDASVSEMIHGPDGALVPGRKTRAISAPLRRALKARDGTGCAFPGCGCCTTSWTGRTRSARALRRTRAAIGMASCTGESPISRTRNTGFGKSEITRCSSRYVPRPRGLQTRDG